MTSFEKIREIRGYQDEKCWLEVKKLKDGVRLSEKREDSRDSRMK